MGKNNWVYFVELIQSSNDALMPSIDKLLNFTLDNERKEYIFLYNKPLKQYEVVLCETQCGLKFGVVTKVYLFNHDFCEVPSSCILFNTGFTIDELAKNRQFLFKQIKTKNIAGKLRETALANSYEMQVNRFSVKDILKICKNAAKHGYMSVSIRQVDIIHSLNEDELISALRSYGLKTRRVENFYMISW